MADDKWGQLSDREKRFRLSEKRQERAEKRLSEPAGSLGEAIKRVPSQMRRNFADRVSQEFGTLGSATVAAIRTPGARTAAFTREVSRGVRGAIADALGSGQIGRYLADKVRSGIRYDKDPQKNFERLRAGLVAASQDFQQIKGTISSVNKQTRELALVVKQVAEKVNRIEREQSVQQRLIDQLKQAADENKPRVSGLGIANNDNNKVSPASIAPQIDSLLSGAVGGALSRIPFSRFAKFGAWGLAAYAGYKAAQLFDQAAKNAPKETEKQIRQAEEDLKSGDPKRQTKALGDLARARSLPQNSETDKANADAIRAGVSIAKTPEEAAITGLVADYQRATTTQEKEVVLSQLSAHDYKTVQSVVSRFQVLGLMNDLDRYNGNKKRNLRKQQKALDQYPDESVRRSRWKDRSFEELGITKQGNVTTIASNTVEVKAGPNTIILNSENTRTTGNLTIKGDLIIEGEVKVKGQPDWAQKAFNPDDNSPNAPRSIRQRRYTRGRAGAIQAPGVFGKASSVTLAERYARMGTNMEKQQFLAYGQLPRGFENVPGHMGILGSPGAVMARGAMPLGQFGGGGTVGGYGGMPSATGEGGGGFSSGSGQSYPTNASSSSGTPVARASSSTTPSVQPNIQQQRATSSQDVSLKSLQQGGVDRSAFINQLTPQNKERLFALVYNEANKKNKDDFADIMETIFNRAAGRSKSNLSKEIFNLAHYFEPHLKGKTSAAVHTINKNPKLMATMEQALGEVMAGRMQAVDSSGRPAMHQFARTRLGMPGTTVRGEFLYNKPEELKLVSKIPRLTPERLEELKKQQTKKEVEQWQARQQTSSASQTAQPPTAGASTTATKTLPMPGSQQPTKLEKSGMSADEVIAKVAMGKIRPGDLLVEQALTVKGLHERRDRIEIMSFLKSGGKANSLNPATTPWCAAFVNASLAKAGLQGTGTAWAPDFFKWGQQVTKPEDVKPGDIVVNNAHVSIATGPGVRNKDGTWSVPTVGGNESDRVLIGKKAFHKHQIRRATEDQYTPELIEKLKRSQNPQAELEKTLNVPSVVASEQPQQRAAGPSPAATMAFPMPGAGTQTDKTVAATSKPQISAFATPSQNLRNERGWITSQSDRNWNQCVALSRAFNPKVGYASQWKVDASIPIVPGSMVASTQYGKGSTPGGRPGAGYHTGIALTSPDSKGNFLILDQAAGMRAVVRQVNVNGKVFGGQAGVVKGTLPSMAALETAAKLTKNKSHLQQIQQSISQLQQSNNANTEPLTQEQKNATGITSAEMNEINSSSMLSDSVPGTISTGEIAGSVARQQPKSIDEAKFLEANVIPEQAANPTIPPPDAEPVKQDSVGGITNAMKMFEEPAPTVASPTGEVAVPMQPQLPQMPVPEGLPGGVPQPPSISESSPAIAGSGMATTETPQQLSEKLDAATTQTPTSTTAATAESAGGGDRGGGAGPPDFRHGPNQAPSPGSQGIGSFGRCYLIYEWR